MALTEKTDDNPQKGFLKTLVAFLSGILVSLIAWLIVDSIKNNRSYSASIKQFFDNFLAL